MIADLIIPALNEAQSIGAVVRDARRTSVRSIIVVDNGSSDGTADVAQAAGARVVREPLRGYGAACQAGIRVLPADTEAVVFLDGDGSDDPGRIDALLEPIRRGQADLVVGSRALGEAEPGSLTIPQRVGNAIASRWLCARFGLAATDLGPFRAIRRDCLEALGMTDTNYGWTVEMQIKAARAGWRYTELAVDYRRRQAGQSVISGTLRGTIGAAAKILGLLAWYDFMGRGAGGRGRLLASGFRLQGRSRACLARSPQPAARSPKPSPALRVSVIIPVLDEEQRLARRLEELRGLGVFEIIVVDGGSRDRTVQIARARPGVRVVAAPRGRGPQMNAGARAAAGDVLLFLHADVSLPPDAMEWIGRTLADPEVVAGAFRTWTVCDDGAKTWLAPLLRLADLRSRSARLPYGDQAIFARREAFFSVGGFPDQPLMEDLELSRRFRRTFGRMVTAPACVRVSGRRFLRRPVFSTVAVNLFPLLYRLGVGPGTLARWYEPIR